MDRVYIYDNFKHLGKNPPQHNAVGNDFKHCDMPLFPVKVSTHEIVEKNRVILTITGVCSIHGEVKYYVRFLK